MGYQRSIRSFVWIAEIFEFWLSWCDESFSKIEVQLNCKKKQVNISEATLRFSISIRIAIGEMWFSRILFKIVGWIFVRKFPKPISIHYMIYLIRWSVSNATQNRYWNISENFRDFGGECIMWKILQNLLAHRIFVV